EPLGDRDGRIALYLTDQLPKLWRPAQAAPGLSEREQRLVEALRSRPSFFDELHQAAGGGFAPPTADALWDLVWKGLVTNDAFYPLRAYLRPATQRGRRAGAATGRAFRSRRLAPPSAEGRWSLVESRAGRRPTDTEWSAALANQLLARWAVVTRDVAQAESIPGGFSAVYDVLKAREEGGKIRRGLFVAGVGGLQFALPPVADLLRSLRQDPEQPEMLTLAAVDPANPYGVLVGWPEAKVARVEGGESGRGPARAVGAHVILVNGAPAAWVARGGRQLWCWLPDEEPDRSVFGRAIAEGVAGLITRAGAPREGVLIEDVDGSPVRSHPLARWLGEVGFSATPTGMILHRRLGAYAPVPAPSTDDGDR
ncbi:MAG: DEAD/DEAH box helicase, partial [Deltaproteobacteria bacterium]|nr:DEAD/DEAH box helicase [Deltaproteobacteria bacterium]